MIFATCKPKGWATRWRKCGLCSRRSWVQPGAVFCGALSLLPSQSIPKQYRLKGITSLLSLLAADEDFNMDMLTSNTFVSTVSAQQWTAQYYWCLCSLPSVKKSYQILQPEVFQLQCSPFIAKNQYKSSQVPALRAPARHGTKGCWRSQVFWVSCCITRAQRLISCKNSSAPSARHLSTSCRGNREGKPL